MIALTIRLTVEVAFNVALLVPRMPAHSVGRKEPEKVCTHFYVPGILNS